MKKKLLVLSASAILASNFVFDNNASAVVRGTDHKSEALSIVGEKHPYLSGEDYKKYMGNLIDSLTIDDFSGYDQPEYNNAYQKYQDRFLGELEAFNQFIHEEGDTEKVGMTIQRYNKILESLKENKNEFLSKAQEIESKNDDLRRFNDEEMDRALEKAYDIEDRGLMAANVFRDDLVARYNLYHKLNIIMGYTKDDKGYKIPTNIPRNERMLKNITEDLETAIDEFFEEIQVVRPINIPKLTSNNKDNVNIINQLKSDAERAKTDATYKDPNVEKRAEQAKAELAKLTENSRKAKDEAKQRAKEKQSKKYKSYIENPEEFKHKTLKQSQTNELSIVFPEPSQSVLTYTVSTQSQTQPALKQQKETYTSGITPRFNQNNTLKGMTGESNLVTMDTHSNASTLSGSNDQVFEFSFESAPQTTNVAQPQTKEAVAAPTNNLAGLSGESNALNFMYDSQPVNNDSFTESNEIVLDQQTYATMSGFTKGESIEDSHVSNEVTK
ncbi:hypothetical protein MUA11_11415 [Staphylococcus agnetis]|uniref:coagulase domain-containing protein n=1 Tax=Staphylococcus agnetis TaxID=985762 RepID=UPI0021D2C374|nr:coagulase domain-containing protein [Staphylococcus agnetis]UXU54876.1 hypothetical protein MUA11_11415 [Staphylococcus agnetis]